MRVQKKTAWIVRIGTLAIAATTIVSGQSQNPKPTAETPPTPTTRQQTVFTATANAVSTNLLVRDAKGQFVPNIRPEEVQVYEDGVLQKLSYFNTVIGGRVTEQIASAAAAPAANDGLILPRAVPPPDMSGRIFIIFIDDLHLEPGQTPQTRARLQEIRDTLIHDNDLVGLVSSGYSSIASDIQYDYKHRRFDEAIKKTMGGGQTPDEIIKAPESQEGPAGIRYLANVAFSTANEILQKAAKITNRRKSFIYVSSGYDFDPYKDSRLKYQQDLYAIPNQNADGSPSVTQSQDAHNYGDPFAKRDTTFSEADLVAQLAELIRNANRANVTFYTLDPRGLVGQQDIGTSLTYEEWHDHLLETTSSLKVIAEQTGGFCICMTNDFKKLLQRIDAETSDYYMVGYNSTNPDPLKIVRKIEIKITRPGVHAENYRTEYALKKPSRKDK
jgi:VWFA-related protein